MKVSSQPYKGARDFYPEDKQFQNWMFNKWRRVVERYGYVEYDAPILEPTDLYRMKGSDEIISDQTYTFTDRGDRSVTIRTEMTPSVSRMVASRRQELAYPIRWYSIPNVWRYERMQRGRLREFWQLNVDLFGVSSNEAEIEMISIVDDLFQSFKAKRSTYQIKVNSRVLINAGLTQAGLTDENQASVVHLIDKIKKMPVEDFAKKLDELTGSKEVSKQVVALLAAQSIEDLPKVLRDLPSAANLKQLLSAAKAQGIKNIEFDSTLMRGFDYYTDIVFEVFDTDPENNRSMFGGGRYDGLVSLFGVEPVPTIGFGMGDVTFQNFLESHKLIPKLKMTTQLRVLLRDESSSDVARRAATELREIGVNTEVDYSGRKIDKQLKSAIKSGVRFVLFVGGEDGKDDLFTLKDTVTGKEQRHSLARIASLVHDSRLYS